MPDNLSIGDALVETLIVFSERGSLNLTTSFVSASIYESIFTPGVVCDITVLDTQDIIGNLQLLGDELVSFQFKSPNLRAANFIFALYEISDQQQLASQRAKTYVIRCVSEEAMFAKTNIVQKSYNDLCSNMVQDICETYLSTKKRVVVEPTRGNQNILVPGKNPFEAIKMIRGRSVSAEDNRSSSYVFFEAREDEEQLLRFCTLESRFATEPVKSFKQSGAININALSNEQDNNILSFKIPQQISSIDRIIFGGPRRITTFNWTTWQFESNDVITSDTNYKDGGSGTDVSASFRNRYYNARIPPQSLIPVDVSSRPLTFIPESSADYQAYIAQLMQNTLKIRVPGDTQLTAGVTIDCTLPSRSGNTTEMKEDPLMSGKFLISRIHHRIGLVQERPRYTCIIEALKGRFEEGIQ
ncbi:hypothetical protein UFOVP395_87 [uncultured Caudovirales phage]|uniref:Uncharacterized protein n=1 Tax=uncultured Caudovirales phage TaxID=2100421 RepID=A0A6J5M3F5_9CAUD|nr:hypothetical protein UFOVP395_87 [uncultured Caudovirales phage]